MSAPTAVGASLVMAGLLVGALGRASAQGGVLRRDSAGIQIVENRAPAWRAGGVWTVASAPLVDIGVLEGDSNYQLDRVRGVLKLRNGQIVVANGGTEQLRFFDASGHFVRAAGRKGGGPGEFTGLSWVRRLPGDSLLTFGGQDHRLSVFSAEGAFILSSLMEMPGGAFPQTLGLLPDLTLLCRVAHMSGRDGLVRDSALYVRYSQAGKVLDTVGLLPGSLNYTLSTTTGTSHVSYSLSVPFAAIPQVVTSRDGFYWGLPEAFQIGVYTGHGKLRRSIRLARPNPALTTEAIATYKAQQAAQRGGDENFRRAHTRMLEEAVYPRVAPAYGALLIDEPGNLWVRGYALPNDSVASWAVFDTAGVFLGDVRTPQGLTVTQIGGDFLIGTSRDPDEIEHVRVFRLIKPK